MKEMERTILKEMCFSWSRDHNDQTGKVYVPLDKKSMFSVNVPRRDVDETRFRETKKAEIFRERVIEIMRDVAERLKLPYEIM